MSWIAVSDGRHALRRPADSGVASPALLTTGTLVIETLLQAQAHRTQTVLEVERRDEWHRRLSVTLGDDGRLAVLHAQGRHESLAELWLASHDHDATLRINYSWDAPARIGWLAVENLTTGRVERRVFNDPLPLPVAEAEAAVEAGPHRSADAAVALIAVSDHVEPVGLPPGMCQTTPVATADGLRPAGSLSPGDLVETAEGGLQPVRHVLSREVPAAGRFAPVALRAPYFGLEQTIRLAPDHRMMITGADAEYLFGTDAVLVEARHLAHLAGLRRSQAKPTARYTQIVLDRHDCLLLGGAWGESLYLGDLRDTPDLLQASSLRRVPPAELPRHGQTAGALLKPYEAMVLVSAMYA